MEKQDECTNLKEEIARLKRQLDKAKENEIRVGELDRVAKMLVRRDMELMRVNDELVESDRAKSHFVSIAAHQLRTPLSVTKWTFRMLLSEDFGSLNEEQREVIERGYNTNEGIIKLVSDLLDVARIESGRFTYNFTPISIEEVVKKIVALVELKAKEKGVELDSKSGGGKNFYVLGDRVSLETVVENLVTNAVNYTLPGGRVGVIYKETGGVVEVRVEDSGVGIQEHQLGRLFTKFFRGDNVVKMQTSGSGLGLFIVKSVITAHGGTVGVESQEGTGSNFWFRIPVKS